MMVPPPTSSPPPLQLIDRLRKKIQGVTAAERASDGSPFSSGCLAIDQILPKGGFPRGSIIQWFTPSRRQQTYQTGGNGAELLSLLAAQNACLEGQAIVIADLDHTFHPPAAAALGVSLSSLIVLRPPEPCHHQQNDDLFWAIDQALRCSAVGAVWGSLGNADPRWLRRFQLSAEQSGTAGLFIRPGHCASQPSWAEIDWQIKPSPITPSKPHNQEQRNQRPISLRLLRAPSGLAGRDITLQFNTITGSVQAARVDHETNPLPLATQLANPTINRSTTST